MGRRIVIIIGIVMVIVLVLVIVMVPVISIAIVIVTVFGGVLVLVLALALVLVLVLVLVLATIASLVTSSLVHHQAKDPAEPQQQGEYSILNSPARTDQAQAERGVALHRKASNH